MADGELDDLERRLMRGVLVRRLVIGIGAIAVGIVLLVMSVVTVRMSYRLLRTAVLMAIFGVAGIIAGFVTLRVGEIRHDLGVHHADPVPWKTIALATSGLAVAIALIAAWPLGVYRWIGTLSSPCRSVLTARDAAALGIAPFDVTHVEQHDSMCSLTGVEPGGERRIVAIEIDGPRSGYRLEDRVRAFRATEDPSVFERSGERLIAVKAEKGAVYVHLSSTRYDADQARRIAKHVGTRLGALDRFPAR